MTIKFEKKRLNDISKYKFKINMLYQIVLFSSSWFYFKTLTNIFQIINLFIFSLFGKTLVIIQGQTAIFIYNK